MAVTEVMAVTEAAEAAEAVAVDQAYCLPLTTPAVMAVLAVVAVAALVEAQAGTGNIYIQSGAQLTNQYGNITVSNRPVKGTLRRPA